MGYFLILWHFFGLLAPPGFHMFVFSPSSPMSDVIPPQREKRAVKESRWMLSRAVMPLCKSAAAQGNDALFIAKVDLCFYFGFLLIFCLILLPDKISKLPNKYLHPMLSRCISPPRVHCYEAWQPWRRPNKGVCLKKLPGEHRTKFMDVQECCINRLSVLLEHWHNKSIID